MTSELNAAYHTGRPQICCCLLLALLFLYNPFLVVTPSSGNLSISHVASYRATVASSELQHFSPTDARKTFEVSLGLLFCRFEVVVDSAVGPTLEVATNHLYDSQLLCADSWFRPPPAI
jgi:hypothetical protein